MIKNPPYGFLLLIFLCSLFFFPLHNAHGKAKEQLQTIQLFFENDLFGDTDKYYTNAVQVTLLSPDLKQYRDDPRLPSWFASVINTFPFINDEDTLHNVGFLFGQQIYTPSDISIQEQIENDHPYAGFLYGGFAFHAKTPHILDTLELVFGIVGPEAFGEFAQNTVHELRDIATAEGWDNQLSNEPALNISWHRKYKLYQTSFFDCLDYDMIVHGGVTAGNVKVSANLGGEIRFGFNIPDDFGSDIIRPGAGISAPLPKRSGTHDVPFGAHIFVSSQIEGVAHDIFLDGNTWTDSPSVDRNPFIGDVSVGLSCNIGMYKITYRHLFRTETFEEQKEGQVIGSLSLTVAF